MVHNLGWHMYSNYIMFYIYSYLLDRKPIRVQKVYNASTRLRVFCCLIQVYDVWVYDSIQYIYSPIQNIEYNLYKFVPFLLLFVDSFLIRKNRKTVKNS
jgi:hypothetical protein